MAPSPPRSVRQAVWPWDEPRRAAARAGRGDDAAVRRAAALQTIALVIGGSLLYLVLGHRTAGLVVWGLALAGLALALVYPPAHEPLLRLGRALGRLAGLALTWALLAPLYFLVFTPAAVMLRLLRRDPLRRRPAPPGRGYWIARRRQPPAASYERQFLVEERT